MKQPFETPVCEPYAYEVEDIMALSINITNGDEVELPFV